jgi:hypothetical protein
MIDASGVVVGELLDAMRAQAFTQPTLLYHSQVSYQIVIKKTL